MARVVVVGAGLAGLCTALALADFGHDVTVVEAGPAAGGQLSTTVVDGADVDLGAVAFTLPAVLRDLFRKTGRPLERELDLLPVDPAVRLVFADGERVDVPNATRAGAMRAFDDALGPGAGGQWDALVQHGERTWQRLRPVVLGQAPGRGRATGRGWAIGRSASPAAGSLRGVGAELLRDERLRALLDVYAAAVGEDPATAPAALTVLPYLEQTFGLWAVDGGTSRLVDVLRDRAGERGATFRFRTPADVVTTGGRVDGVRLSDGELLSADVVVWTAQPALLSGVALGGRRLLRRSRSPVSGSSVLTTVLAASPPASPPPRIVVVPSAGTPAVTLSATTAGWVLHASCPPHGDGPGAVDWSESGLGSAHAARLVDLVSAAGIDLGGQARVELVRTPYDLERAVGAPGGRVHGLPAEGVSALVRRPSNTTRVRGLFLAGSGAHPGPGVALAGISAAIVTDLVGRA